MFTDQELKLITRALNTYSRVLTAVDNNEPSEESLDAEALASKIYQEHFKL